MLFETFYFFVEILYPAYWTIRKLNSCEEERFPRFLKYWALLPFIWALEALLELAVHPAVFTMIRLPVCIALVYGRFKVSSFLFDNILLKIAKPNMKQITEVVDSIEGKINEVLGDIKEKINDKFMGIIPGIRDLVMNLIFKRDSN